MHHFANLAVVQDLQLVVRKCAATVYRDGRGWKDTEEGAACLQESSCACVASEVSCERAQEQHQLEEFSESGLAMHLAIWESGPGMEGGYQSTEEYAQSLHLPSSR